MLSSDCIRQALRADEYCDYRLVRNVRKGLILHEQYAGKGTGAIALDMLNKTFAGLDMLWSEKGDGVQNFLGVGVAVESKPCAQRVTRSHNSIPTRPMKNTIKAASGKWLLSPKFGHGLVFKFVRVPVPSWSVEVTLRAFSKPLAFRVGVHGPGSV